MKGSHFRCFLFSLFAVLIHLDVKASERENSNFSVLNTSTVTDNLSIKSKKRLQVSANFFFISYLAGAGILFVLPESITNWDRSEILKGIKWWKNVKRPPVWDKDDWFINYVLHPYWGMTYYLQGRQAGYSILGSFAVSFAGSVIWEYGIEAFAERPSIQDLIVTPLGSIFGELALKAILSIEKNDYRLFNSRFIGKLAIISLDPFHLIVNRKMEKKMKAFNRKKISLSVFPVGLSEGFASLRIDF